jgi:AcrR family transcriptional regulator
VAARKPRPDLRDQREEEILEAAAAVFAERGFRASRIDDVAARAGLGKGTIYEYFRSKEDLFLRLFHWYTRRVSVSLEQAAGEAEASPLEGLKRACDALLVSCREMQDLYPLTMEFWSASTAPEFREGLTKEFRQLYIQFRRDIAERIRSAVVRGEVRPNVEPGVLAGVLIGALDGIILQAWFDPDFDPLHAGRHFLEVLTWGMTAVPRVGEDEAPPNEVTS